MLQSIRDKTQGVITWVIVALVSVTFAFWGVSSYFISNGNAKPVAKINGEAVSVQEFAQVYRNMQQQQAMGQASSIDNEARFKETVLHQLIQQKILTQSARKQGFVITDDEIYGLLSKVPDLMIDDQFSMQRLSQMLAHIGVSQAQFFQDIRNRMLISQIQDGIIDSSFVLPKELQSYADLYNQTRDFEFAVVPFDSMLKDVADDQITDGEIDAYYTAHRRDYMTPATVSLQYVELSQDALEKQLSADKAKQAFAEMADKLANLSYENPETLDVVSNDLNLPIKKTSSFSAAGDPRVPLTQNDEVLKAAFSNDLKRDRYNSDVISLDPKTLVVVRVLNSTEAKPRPQSDVRGDIIKQLKIREAKLLAQELASKVASTANDQGALTPVADKFGFRVVEKKNVKRDADDINETILNTAFSMTKPQGNQAKFVSFTLNNGAVVVFGLTNVTDHLGKADSKLAKSLGVQLSSNFGKIDYELYRQSMLSQAKVKIYHNLPQGE